MFDKCSLKAQGMSKNLAQTFWRDDPDAFAKRVKGRQQINRGWDRWWHIPAWVAPLHWWWIPGTFFGLSCILIKGIGVFFVLNSFTLAIKKLCYNTEKRPSFSILPQWPIQVRNWSRYQNEWIFGKLPKGGGGSFSIQKIILQVLGTSNRAF